MFEPIRQMFRPRRQVVIAPQVPADERYYVIGDVHGRLDLFDALVTAIEEDALTADGLEITLVLLGDLIDRGPDSCGVVERTMALSRQHRVRCLAGNHEEMFLRSFEDTKMLRHFVKHGGRETILSYGLDRSEYDRLSLDELRDCMDKQVSHEHREFLAAFDEMLIAGDYVFVHAGVDVSRPLEQQTREDLLWIRERFLDCDTPYSHTVVHGHTIVDEVFDNGTRIGIDTGAYRTGRLTALILEGAKRRYINTVEHDGSITIEKTDG